MTGKEFGNLQETTTFSTYPHRYEFNIIVLFERSLLTLLNRLLSKGNVMSSGVKLELENPEELGQKRDGQLILRIQNLSSGAATRVKRILSLTNSEEISESAIYSDGWIDILSSWKLKDRLLSSKRKRSGSQATSIQENGTPCLTPIPMKPSKEDLKSLTSE